MCGHSTEYRPKARKTRLVVRELDGETLVYDLGTHQAHCLDAVTARVWRHCDGEQTLDEIADALETDQVDNAIQQLHTAGLLTEKAPTPPPSSRAAETVTRRRALQAAAVTATILTITAPRPAQAASCIASGDCLPIGGNGNTDCCSGGASPTGGPCISGWSCN